MHRCGKDLDFDRCDLPENGPVLAFAEDPVNPRLLFAGTEFGPCSLRWGKNGFSLRAASRDCGARHGHSGTRGRPGGGPFGRGFYVLDDIRPLRELKPETAQGASLFPVKKTLLYVKRILWVEPQSVAGSSLYCRKSAVWRNLHLLLEGKTQDQEKTPRCGKRGGEERSNPSLPES